MFNMKAETNLVIWSIRNEVLLSYKQNRVENMTSLVRPIMSRITNEVFSPHEIVEHSTEFFCKVKVLVQVIHLGPIAFFFSPFILHSI